MTGLSDLAFERYMCIDRVVNSTSTDGVSGQQQVVRQLLVSEARVVLVLYSQRSWLDFIMVGIADKHAAVTQFRLGFKRGNGYFREIHFRHSTIRALEDFEGLFGYLAEV